MFLSREIDIKLCQNYTKTDICQILYKSCSIQNLRFSGFILYPLSFFLYSPFNQAIFWVGGGNLVSTFRNNWWN